MLGPGLGAGGKDGNARGLWEGLVIDEEVRWVEFGDVGLGCKGLQAE